MKIILLLAGQVSLQTKMTQTDHRIHRCTKLMAHVGQKLVLDVACSFRMTSCLFCGFQFLNFLFKVTVDQLQHPVACFHYIFQHHDTAVNQQGQQSDDKQHDHADDRTQPLRLFRSAYRFSYRLLKFLFCNFPVGNRSLRISIAQDAHLIYLLKTWQVCSAHHALRDIVSQRIESTEAEFQFLDLLHVCRVYLFHSFITAHNDRCLYFCSFQIIRLSRCGCGI